MGKENNENVANNSESFIIFNVILPLNINVS